MSLIEIEAMDDEVRKRRVKQLLPMTMISLSETILQRGEWLSGLGMKPADSVHVAAAEAADADVFLTCDDRLWRVSRRLGTRLNIRVANPLIWLQEQTDAQDT